MNPSLRRIRLLMAALAPAGLLAAMAGPAMAAPVSDHATFSVLPGTLAFLTAPNLAGVSFGTTTLNGQAQTVNATMPNYSVNDATGSAAGWNVTVNGDNTAPGVTSPVFAQYCTLTLCGTDPAGYTPSGATLPANSLTFDSVGGSFAPVGTTSNVNAPTNSCASGCAVDAASPGKIASAAAGGGMGQWTTQGFNGTSLALKIPTTARSLKTGEVYRVDLQWTLNTGP